MYAMHNIGLSKKIKKYSLIKNIFRKCYESVSSTISLKMAML